MLRKIIFTIVAVSLTITSSLFAESEYKDTMDSLNTVADKFETVLNIQNEEKRKMINYFTEWIDYIKTMPTETLLDIHYRDSVKQIVKDEYASFYWNKYLPQKNASIAGVNKNQIFDTTLIGVKSFNMLMDDPDKEALRIIISYADEMMDIEMLLDYPEQTLLAEISFFIYSVKAIKKKRFTRTHFSKVEIDEMSRLALEDCRDSLHYFIIKNFLPSHCSHTNQGDIDKNEIFLVSEHELIRPLIVSSLEIASTRKALMKKDPSYKHFKLEFWKLRKGINKLSNLYFSFFDGGMRDVKGMISVLAEINNFALLEMSIMYYIPGYEHKPISDLPAISITELSDTTSLQDILAFIDAENPKVVEEMNFFQKMISFKSK